MVRELVVNARLKARAVPKCESGDVVPGLRTVFVTSCEVVIGDAASAMLMGTVCDRTCCSVRCWTGESRVVYDVIGCCTDSKLCSEPEVVVGVHAEVIFKVAVVELTETASFALIDVLMAAVFSVKLFCI